MDQKKLERMTTGKGFIAALDQSGGSTPKALGLYGVDQWKDEAEMFDLVHAMRSRIMTSKAFTDERILGAILFEMTMDREVEGMPTPDYLWEKKGVLPFLKIDRGLADEANGVRLMKPHPDLEALLDKAVSKRIFGTKMRSVILEPNEEAIHEVVQQQFDWAVRIWNKGLVPIVEPEVDIHAPEKAKCEEILLKELLAALKSLPGDVKVIFKLTIPTVADYYRPLAEHERVVRLVALSGGYSREESNALLKKNTGMIASFSRALTEGLNAKQTQEEFDTMLDSSIQGIWEASVQK